MGGKLCMVCFPEVAAFVLLVVSCSVFLFLLLFRNQTRPEQNIPFGGLGLGRTRTGPFE